MEFGLKDINKSAGRCFVLLLVAIFFPVGSLMAGAFSGTSHTHTAGGYAETTFMAGYRQDSLDWNINGAGNPVGSSPNILSELTWRDLDIFQMRGEIVAANTDGIYFRGSAGYGWVLGGENQDSDYAGDDRTLEFSRSINGVDGSRVSDIKGGLGVEFPFGAQEKHRFVPLLGYSYHSQQLKMTDGNQVVFDLANLQVFDPSATGTIPLGSFSGLNSSYDATWSGLWLGTDILLDLEDRGSMYLHLERHWPKYEAKANWNLRDDFAHPVSFEHEANGRGWVMELGWHNQPARNDWVWGASMTLQSWTTSSGTDRTFLVIPGPPCNGNCYTEGILNEVNWFSKSINITLSKKINP